MLSGKKIQKDLNCHNCGYPLRGDENYCPYCSQKNDIRPLSIKHFFANFFGNFFNFDNKIWRTVIRLIRYPGRVPLEYINGKRTTYSNPFKFLLQVSILYFLLSGFLNLIFSHKSNPIVVKQIIEEKNSIQKYFDSINRQTHFLELIKNKNVSKTTKDSLLNHIIALQHNEMHIDSSSIDNISRYGYNDLQDYLKKYKIIHQFYPQIPKKINYKYLNWGDKLLIIYKTINNQPYRKLNEKATLDTLKLKHDFANKLAVKLAKKADLVFTDPNFRKTWQQTIISKISMGLFFILPLLALFYQLFYWRKHSYTETLVYLFYVQSLYFLVLIIELIIVAPFPANSVSIFTVLLNLWFVYYLYKSSKIFYKDSKFKNVLKTVFLVLPGYAFLAGVGLLIISIISLLF